VINVLRCLFLVILVAMLAGTVWASLEEDVSAGGSHILSYRWGWMTLADAYFGFITFYVWVAYKETTLVARLGWLVAILVLGNIAMSVYVLIQLFRVSPDASLDQVLLRRNAT
jgi:predicted permease